MLDWRAGMILLMKLCISTRISSRRKIVLDVNWMRFVFAFIDSEYDVSLEEHFFMKESKVAPFTWTVINSRSWWIHVAFLKNSERQSKVTCWIAFTNCIQDKFLKYLDLPLSFYLRGLALLLFAWILGPNNLLESVYTIPVKVLSVWLKCSLINHITH